MSANPKELEEESVRKLFWRYSLPAIIATMSSSIYNIIDRIFIGQGVGALAISGLSITLPLMNLAIALGTLVGAGASAIVSIRLGEKRPVDATRTLGNALVLNVLIGVVFAIFALIFLDPILYLFGASDDTISYARDFMRIILYGNVITHVFFGLNSIMRASGYPAKAMISVLLTVLINVILAPIFIFVLDWGIKGAAWATVFSQTVGLVWVLIHFLNPKSTVHFTPACFKLQRKIILNTFSIGASPFMIHIATSLVVIIINLQLKTYSGDLAIGAYGIINSVVSLVVMIILGFTQGMQPIVGYNFGANKIKRAMDTLKLTIICACVTSTIGFLLCLFMPSQIARAFTIDSTLIEITSHGLVLSMLMLPIIGFQISVSNFFQSIGMAGTAIVLSLSRQVLCLIPLLFIFPLFWGIDGVWLATPAADFISALITALFLINFIKKRKLLSEKSSL